MATHDFEIPADVEPGDHHLVIHGLAGGDPVITVVPIVIGDGGEIVSVEGAEVAPPEPKRCSKRDWFRSPRSWAACVKWFIVRRLLRRWSAHAWGSAWHR